MAHAHVLAKILSERTGADWEVTSGMVTEPRWDTKNNHAYPAKIRRYRLRITRGEFHHTFQAHRPFKLNELTRWLASIADMFDMGFLDPFHFNELEPGKSIMVGRAWDGDFYVKRTRSIPGQWLSGIEASIAYGPTVQAALAAPQLEVR